MANQYTKRKERLAAEAAARYAKTAKNTDDHAREKVAETAVKCSWGAATVDLLNAKEPVCALNAGDNFTPILMQHWLELAYENGTSYDTICRVKALQREINEWRTNNPLLCKVHV